MIWCLWLLWLAPAALVPLDEDDYARLLAAHRGEVLVVNFWATWCEPCRAEMPALAKFSQRWRHKKVRLIAVAVDEPEQDASAAGFLATSGIIGPSYRKLARNDEQFINRVDPNWRGTLPFTVVYDRRGNRVISLLGEAQLGALEKAVRRLAGTNGGQSEMRCAIDAVPAKGGKQVMNTETLPDQPGQVASRVSRLTKEQIVTHTYDHETASRELLLEMQEEWESDWAEL